MKGKIAKTHVFKLRVRTHEGEGHTTLREESENKEAALKKIFKRLEVNEILTDFIALEYVGTE